MNFRKILYVVLLAAMLQGVRAANLETKSGRYLEDYTIIKQSGLTVTVRHMDGETKIPLADLPDDIAAPYIQKAIEREAEAAKQGKNPAKRVRRLKQLAEQLPAVRAQIDALIAKLPQEEQTGTAKLPKSETPEGSQSGGQTAESGKDQPSGLARGETFPKQSPDNARQQDDPHDREPVSTASNTTAAPDSKEREAQLKETWEKQQNYSPDREKWQAIFQSCFLVEQAMNKAKAMQIEARKKQDLALYERSVPILEDIIRQHPQAANIEDAQTMLDFSRKMIERIPAVNKTIQSALEAESSKEMITMLRLLVYTHFDVPNIPQAEKKLADCETVAEAISKAQEYWDCSSNIKALNDVRTYTEKVRLLEDAMSRAPAAPNIAEARSTCAGYRESLHSANARLAAHRCPTCGGRGSVLVEGVYQTGSSYLANSNVSVQRVRGWQPCQTCGGTGYR